MSTSSTLSLDHHHQQSLQQQQQQLPHPSEQLCYVHCDLCDTVLAVSVPCTSLFKTVTVRCGHCTNLLPVNMRALLLPSANQLHLGHNFFTPPHNLLGVNLLQEEMTNMPSPNFAMMNQMSNNNNNNNNPLNNFTAVSRESTAELLPRPPTANRPPEKRQRVPSAYNRFIKDEIQRIKAGNPDISHREAFSAAAKNWAHFPHIHFGLMPDQTVKKPATMRPQDGETINNMVKDGYFPSANVGVSPY